MKADIVVRVLIVKGLLILFSSGALAWTVSDSVVEMPQGGHESVKQSVPVSSEKENKGEKRIVKDGVAIFEKTRSTLTAEEQAATDYEYALEHFGAGDNSEAEKVLIKALNHKPNHHASRIELATLYLKKERLEEAEQVLQEGLRIDENHPDFLKLMAILHDKREEPEKALTLLVKVKDSKRHDKNYVAFLGHIYQQTGQYSLARQQYFRLLQSEPKNPIWLLGVSIALDAEGQRDAALEGYYQLKKEGKIDPKILKYVQDRIKILKG